MEDDDKSPTFKEEVQVFADYKDGKLNMTQAIRLLKKYGYMEPIARALLRSMSRLNVTELRPRKPRGK